MKIIDFPYERPSKSLQKAVKWLNQNRKRLEKENVKFGFDYPNYFDMPKVISSRLSGDEVDWLQSEVNDWNFKGKEE